MEDKKLNEKESLELITQMIQNAKQKMEKNAGMPFLIWGYMTTILSLLVFAFAFIFMMIIPGHYMNRVARQKG